MKTKALIFLIMGVTGAFSSLQAGPPVSVWVGRNGGCNPGGIPSRPIFFQPTVVCRPSPIFFQPYYSTSGFSPNYFTIGPTTVTFNSGPVTPSSVSPIVVPPPVILNPPAVVSPGTTFSWKR